MKRQIFFFYFLVAVIAVAIYHLWTFSIPPSALNEEDKSVLNFWRGMVTFIAISPLLIILARVIEVSSIKRFVLRLFFNLGIVSVFEKLLSKFKAKNKF